MVTFSASPSQIGWGTAELEAASSTKKIKAAARDAANLRTEFVCAELFSTLQIQQCKCSTAARRLRLFLR